MSEVAHPDSYTNVLVDKPNTTLCELAEERLRNALAVGGIICVNGLVVKANGLVVAVATEPIEVEGGIIEPGAFYQIYDHSKSARQKERQIVDAFMDGETDIVLPGTTEWFKARPVRFSPHWLEDAVNNAVAKLAEEGRPSLPDRESRRVFLNEAFQAEFPEA